MQQILECVPNFSEGRNNDILDGISSSICSVNNTYLLHRDISPAANRTVFTFAGAPDAVIESAFRAIHFVAQHIDMRNQSGVHPRIGATDVCPIVPLKGMSMQEADVFAKILAKKVGEELGIPTYLYEYSQTRTYRNTLPQIRKGQYEGFEDKMKIKEWLPDYGPQVFNSITGATVIGARKILVAFNISLSTNNFKIANEIAKLMRSSTYGEYSLPFLRAIAWYMADYDHIQVSFNLLDYTQTSLLKVWQTCYFLAQKYNIEILGSEVIGLIPKQCLQEVVNHMNNIDKNLNYGIEDAISFLKLNALKKFNPEEKILDFAIKNKILL